MLTNILPGLRDVRTPLTTGFIYSFTAWILFGKYLPPRSEVKGLLKSIYDLYLFTGKPAALAACSFIAYLMGILSGLFLRWLFEWIKMPFTPPVLVLNISEMARADLASNIFSQLHEVSYGRVRYGDFYASLSDEPEARIRALWATQRGIPSEEGRLYKAIETRLAYEQDQLRIKLLVSNPEIYAEHDRHRAEAEFRVGVGAALTVLLIALSVSQSPFWGTALLVPAACLLAGVAKRREANDVLIQAVVAGELVPSLIGETIEQWRTLRQQPPSPIPEPGIVNDL
ncbi:hypothetical protein [Streptomyces sp. NPDC001401]|uniref:hypothetical protein n=1 Tax=Streptomyces sp. NPDC001401 TaxID=3364570 RepID=UPI0036BE822F